LAGAWQQVRLRVGIIGLGRLWEARHKPALARLTDRFRVVAVYDQVGRRTAIEAAQLGCMGAESLTGLIGRDDVDAVYLLTPQWFGLHPIELACEAGKPIYSALPPASDPAGLETAAQHVRSAGIPFMPELARRFYPATLRLRELLANTLGPPRLVLGHSRLYGFDRYGPPGPSTQLTPAPLSIDPGGNLLDWCRFVFQAEPATIQGFGALVLPPDKNGDSAGEPGCDFEGFALEFAAGELAHIDVGRYHREAWCDASRFLPQPGFQVFAERGAAWLEMPDRIQWTGPSGTVHDERLPMEPTVGEILNDHFHRLVRGEQSLAPSLHDALAIARLVGQLQRSQQEGRKFALTEAGPTR
jgi:predicted dehydrogenase